MPKQTFFNLSPEKQAHLLRHAVDEFYAYGYDKASLSRIVERAGIAKGSFYQYFDGKNDLYRYIVEELMIKRKLNKYKELRSRAADFSLTDYLTFTSQSIIEDFADDAKLVKMGLEFAQHLDSPLAQEILKQYANVQANFYVPIIEEKQQQGQVDPNIDPLVLNYMLMGLSTLWTRLLVTRGMNPESYDYIMDCLDKVKYILNHGILPDGGESIRPVNR